MEKYKCPKCKKEFEYSKFSCARYLFTSDTQVTYLYLKNLGCNPDLNKEFYKYLDQSRVKCNNCIRIFAKKEYDKYERKKKRQNKWGQKRRKDNINYRMRGNLNSILYEALKNNSKSEKVKELLGCTSGELKQHLEDQFQSGMSWENYGNGRDGWEVDHIKPYSLFDMSKESKQRECFHYTNLQPMLIGDNRKKQAKYE